MQYVFYFGRVTTTQSRAQALDVALSVCAADYSYDDIHSEEYDIALTDGFVERFPPTIPGKVLSGFLAEMYPGLRIEDIDYAEARGSVKYLPTGLLINSDRGDVEAAARALELILKDDDTATIWWSTLDGLGIPVCGVISTLR